jgi:uncharacterized protein
MSTQLDLRTVSGLEMPLDLVFKPEDLVAPVSTDALVADPVEFRLVGDVRFKGKVLKDEPRYRMTGKVTATLEVACGRCLEPFTLPVAADIDLTYLPDPHAEKPVAAPVARGVEAELELAEEDLTTAYYRGQVLDLGDMLREQFYLAMPMRLLCREDCQGLCAQCGTNKNQGTCQCDVRWEDPRLAGLKALMKKSERPT